MSAVARTRCMLLIQCGAQDVTIVEICHVPWTCKALANVSSLKAVMRGAFDGVSPAGVWKALGCVR